LSILFFERFPETVDLTMELCQDLSMLCFELFIEKFDLSILCFGFFLEAVDFRFAIRN
jgi:hypothetical protein